MERMDLDVRVVTKENLATVRETNSVLRLQRARPIEGVIVDVAEDGQSGYVLFEGPPPQRVFFSAAELDAADGIDDGWGT